MRRPSPRLAQTKMVSTGMDDVFNGVCSAAAICLIYSDFTAFPPFISAVGCVVPLYTLFCYAVNEAQLVLSGRFGLFIKFGGTSLLHWHQK